MEVMLQLLGLMVLLYLVAAGTAWLLGRHIPKGQ